MQIDNLTPSNVDELQKKIAELAEENPDIRSTVYNQDRSAIDHFKLQTSEKLDELIDRTQKIESLLKQIFDGHILINGEFKKINV